MTLVWITRAAEGAERTHKILTDKGMACFVAPVLEIHDLTPAIDPAAFDALIVTSRNGVNSFARLCDRRDLPVWCVGDATAEAAKDHSFTDVLSAKGDIAALFERMKTKAPHTSRYLYACAAEPSAPLTAWLWAEGFRAAQVPVYETRELTPDLTAGQIAAITHVLLLSPRTARAAAQVIAAHDGAFAVDALTFICISEGTAQALETALKAKIKNYPAGGLTKRISPFPDEASTLMLIE